MALKKRLLRADNRVKGEFFGAYFRVQTVEMTETGSRIRVVAFADAEARKLALEPQQTPDCPMPHMMRGPGDIGATLMEKTYETVLPAAPVKIAGEYGTLQEQAKASAYVYLKTLPEFDGAEDC
jgi:hypothetical protein